MSLTHDHKRAFIRKMIEEARGKEKEEEKPPEEAQVAK